MDMTKLPIQEWCDALGITQAALARRARLTTSVVSDYARGRRNPTLKSITALARALDRTPWEFLRGPMPGEGLPTEHEARIANLEWFQQMTPSQRARAAEASRRLALRAKAFAREHGGRSARR
jgi:transcriptional regulator with XRE-family HTH domain